MRGVGRQMEAFKEGFNSVYPLSSLQGLICPGEVYMCGLGGRDGGEVERGGSRRRGERREERRGRKGEGRSRLIWEDRRFGRKGGSKLDHKSDCCLVYYCTNN